jgi:hypothetical protein
MKSNEVNMVFPIGTRVEWLGWNGIVVEIPKDIFKRGVSKGYPLCVLFATKELMGHDEYEFFTNDGCYYLGQEVSLHRLD